MSTEDSKREPQRLERRGIPSPPSARDIRRTLPAWAVSLLFHVAVVGSLTVFWVGTTKGTGGEKDRPMGIAVVHQTAGTTDYFLTGDGETNDAEEAAANSLPSSADSQAHTSASDILSQNDLLPGATDAGVNASNAAGSVGLGDGGGKLGGKSDVPSVKTSIFGIEGEGTRFLYVFDCSESMNGYGKRPLLAAKSELLQSLESLGPVHQFQIIFYNDTPYPFGGLSGPPKLFTGEKLPKLEAQKFVRNRPASGGTEHCEAMRMAIGMQPDVIFFLTDAETAPGSRDMENLYERANRIGATIHTIQFGTGAGARSGSWLKALANATGGEFRYVDVTQLP